MVLSLIVCPVGDLAVDFVYYLHCGGTEWQPRYLQAVEMQIPHLLRLLTAYLHQHNLWNQGAQHGSRLWDDSR